MANSSAEALRVVKEQKKHQNSRGNKWRPGLCNMRSSKKILVTFSPHIRMSRKLLRQQIRQRVSLFVFIRAVIVNFRIKVAKERILTNQNLGFSRHKPIMQMHPLHTRAVSAIHLTRRAIKNDEYVILCNFGGHILSGFEVIGRELRSLAPVAGGKKMPGLNRVNKRLLEDQLPS